MMLEDEFVQDSEDEEMFAPLILPPAASTMEAKGREAARDDNVTSPPPHKPSIASNDASTTLHADQPATSNVALAPAAPRPRPRPRPAYKGALAKTAASSEITGTAIAPAPTTSESPARPDTTRLANPPVASPSSSTTMVNAQTTLAKSALTEDADMFSLDIAERAKLRSRARTSKATSEQPAPLDDPDIIEISSSDDEVNLRPARGPKSKIATKALPSPKKRAKTAHTPADLTLDDASSAIIPIATSNSSSQLPPSEPPPQPTPLVSTPANARPMPGAASSPLSSPIPAPPRLLKRKRKAVPNVMHESDEDGTVSHRGALRKEDSGLAMPPPPLPFADPAHTSDTLIESTSSMRTSDGPGAAKPSKSNGKRKVIDDDDFEDEWPVDPPPKPKPRQRKKAADEDDAAPKPARKSRKKAADEDDEDEWAGDAPPKRKPRAPPKKKSKKNEAPKQVVEVVIDTPPKRARKGRAGKTDAQPPPAPAGDVAGDKDTSKDRLSPLSDLDAEPGRESIPPHGRHTPSPATPNPAVPVLRDGESILNSPRSKSKSKGKKRAIIDSDEEENGEGEREQPGSPPKKPRREPTKGRKSAPAALEREHDGQEGDEPESSIRDGPRARLASNSAVTAPFKSPLPAPGSTPKLTMTHRAYTIGGGRSSQLPMSELLKKVNSQPGSPFASPRPTYSPYTKASKSLLRKIAPLHPNRRTPPPPLPRPPPPKKSKKQLELEEKWEMELEESIEGWYCMPEEERAALRKAKRDAEMGFED